MDKTIHVTLSADGIDEAIREIEAFQKELNTRCGTAVTAVAQKGAELIDANMPGGKTYDEKGIESGSDTSHSTSVESTSGNNPSATVSVEGPELLFIEFGSGVHYNGEVGSSPHPLGGQMGYTIGSYGAGHGEQDVWGYKNGNGTTLSHGTAAAMPVYKTYEELRDGAGLEAAKTAFD